MRSQVLITLIYPFDNQFMKVSICQEGVLLGEWYNKINNQNKLYCIWTYMEKKSINKRWNLRKDKKSN